MGILNVFFAITASVSLLISVAHAAPKTSAFIIVDNPPAPVNSLSSIYLKSNLKSSYDQTTTYTVDNLTTPETEASAKYEAMLKNKYGTAKLKETLTSLRRQREHENIDQGVESESVRKSIDEVYRQIEEAEKRITPEERAQGRLLDKAADISKDQKLINELESQLKTNDAVDIFVAAHTNNYERYLNYIPKELRKKIRLVYNSGCTNSHDARKWLIHGVGAYVAHPGSSFSPMFVRKFIKRWEEGLPLNEAVSAANADLEAELADPTAACIAMLPSMFLDSSTFLSSTKENTDGFIGACILKLQEKTAVLSMLLPADFRCMLDSNEFKNEFVAKADDKAITESVKTLLENTKARLYGQSSLGIKTQQWPSPKLSALTAYDQSEFTQARETRDKISRELNDSKQSRDHFLKVYSADQRQLDMNPIYLENLESIVQLERRLKAAEAVLKIYETDEIPAQRKLQNRTVREDLNVN